MLAAPPLSGWVFMSPGHPAKAPIGALRTGPGPASFADAYRMRVSRDRLETQLYKGIRCSRYWVELVTPAV